MGVSVELVGALVDLWACRLNYWCTGRLLACRVGLVGALVDLWAYTAKLVGASDRILQHNQKKELAAKTIHGKHLSI
ncbi:hypothetical protein P4646_07825 [Peribacillus simplex]|uniref:hypothetical protein n=1 Tax=Peribacillus simplex TaxID=1478 RepID=UPI002E216ACC|nr:hypothetical protein [Peribacillus simplex]